MVVAEINISLTDAGQVQVTGAIENKIVAYGLLKIAEEVVKTFHDDKQKRIQPVTTEDITKLRGLDGGRNN